MSHLSHQQTLAEQRSKRAKISSSEIMVWGLFEFYFLVIMGYGLFHFLCVCAGALSLTNMYGYIIDRFYGHEKKTHKILAPHCRYMMTIDDVPICTSIHLEIF